MFRGWRWKVKSTYIYIYGWCIYIYIDGHAPCRICVAKFGVKREKPNQVRLCNYIAPWWILLARLGEGWRSLREIGTERRWTSCMAPRSFAATCVCWWVWMRCLAIYIYIWKNSIKNAPCKNNIYIYNCEKSFCNSPKMPIRIFANFESPFRTIADFSAIGFLCV